MNTPWFGTFLGDWLMEGNEVLGGQSCRRSSLDYDCSNGCFLARNLPCLVDVWQTFDCHATGYRQSAECCTRFYTTNITSMSFINIQSLYATKGISYFFNSLMFPCRRNCQGHYWDCSRTWQQALSCKLDRFKPMVLLPLLA